jgi:hypothetical protein
MKKVYGSTKPLLFVSLFFLLPISFWSLNGFLFSKWSFNSYWEVVLPLFFFLCPDLINRFVSFWAYDEKGFETRTMIGKFLKSYKWEEVSSLNWCSGLRTSTWNHWAEFDVKDEAGVSIGYFYTHNHLTVLADIVRIAKSKKIYVDPEILKIIELVK